jgi:hypothetical protein
MMLYFLDVVFSITVVVMAYDGRVTVPWRPRRAALLLTKT